MQHIKKLLVDSKYYYLASLSIFLVGTWMGYVHSHVFEALILQAIEQLQGVLEELDLANNPFEVAWFIFLNNARVSIYLIVFGSIFFFFPIFAILINGVMLGYVLQISSEADLSPLEVFVYSIMPHGILELPAILMAGGIGLFLGIRILKWLFVEGKIAAIFSGKYRSEFRNEWQREDKPVLISRVKGIIMITIALTIILFIAAMIEAYITPALMERYLIPPS